MKIDCGHLIAGLGNEYCTLKQDREISPGKKSLFKFQNNCLNHRKIIETIGGIYMNPVNLDSENALRLKEYLERLGKGEPLESVQKDFREAFGQAAAEDIVKAEQILIHSGTPTSEIEKLCDLHSALFHDQPKPVSIKDMVANKGTIRMKTVQSGGCGSHGHDYDSMPSALATQVVGHPLNIMTLENRELEMRLNHIQTLLDQQAPASDLEASLADLMKLGAHYAKKDELILPLLKYYGVGGPAVVMWNLDDELRDTNKKLLSRLKNDGLDPAKMIQIRAEIQRMVDRMREMIFKEERILYPMAERYFTEEEWRTAYYDMPRFGFAWLEEIPVWNEAGPKPSVRPSIASLKDANEETKIELGGGQLTLAQLNAMLNTLPLELTFIDDQNISRYFSEDSFLFPRPTSSLGHEVFDCHPPKVLPVVRHVIEQLRSREKNIISIMANKQGRKALVRYMAVRDENGKYLGVLEAVEDVTNLIVPSTDKNA